MVNDSSAIRPRMAGDSKNTRPKVGKSTAKAAAEHNALPRHHSLAPRAKIPPTSTSPDPLQIERTPPSRDNMAHCRPHLRWLGGLFAFDLRRRARHRLPLGCSTCVPRHHFNHTRADWRRIGNEMPWSGAGRSRIPGRQQARKPGQAPLCNRLKDHIRPSRAY